jgi:uncharacterized protein
MIFAILTGLSIGALGSFHCVGMCGPIALALPVGGKSPIEKAISVLLYNLGRASSYAFMGLIFGLLGSTFSVFGLQQWLSVVAGSSDTYYCWLSITFHSCRGHPLVN